jgi:hypothetical protein
MKKSPILALLLPALAAMSIVPHSPAGGQTFRDDSEPDGSGTGETTPAKPGRKITMDDGRELTFSEKSKIQKEYGTDKGNVFARIDFDNGKTVTVIAYAGNLAEIAAGDSDEKAAATVALQAMGHGLVQKLGDAAAGAESTDDAFEAILEVANRFNKGEWNKNREGGGGSAKGSSELVLAMTEYMQKQNPDTQITKDTVRELLSNLSAGEKAALRKVPELAEIIERIKAERTPTAKDAAKVAAASALLAGLAKGELPKREAAAEAPAA